MKKLLLLFSLCCVLLACASCRADTQPPSQEVSIDGQTAVVTFDPENYSAGTVSTQHGEYSFAYDRNGEVTITYPDGYVYTQRNMNGAIAMPVDYDAAEREAKGYVSGLSLVWGIESAMKSDSRDGGSPSLLLALLLIGFGVWSLCAPKSAWWIAHGWRYKNAEPSDLAIGLYRVGGGALVFIGILCGIAAF